MSRRTEFEEQLGRSARYVERRLLQSGFGSQSRRFEPGSDVDQFRSLPVDGQRPLQVDLDFRFHADVEDVGWSQFELSYCRGDNDPRSVY